MLTVEYTRKSIDKIHRLTNLKADAAKKLIRRAFVNGTDIEDLSTKDKAYFENFIDTSKRTGLVYGEFCYVFADNYCVNVLRTPKKINYIGKDKIKNPKRYTKHYSYGLSA